MLGYCTLGTNDLKTAADFYEPIARILGHSRIMESDRNVMWGSPGKGAMFGVIAPYDGAVATAGNGTMFGFDAETEEQVHQVYEHALANGGSDEGPPGPRGDGDMFYGAYFRDPAGNKLVVYRFKAAPQ
jgi:catechol 2,3-dioxygenase-like lactoylglutathione lyase family enzyme